MLLLEHDAKELARSRGVPIPSGIFVEPRMQSPVTPPGNGPWVVKAQVAVGGRGKAGGVGFATTPDDVVAFMRAHGDMPIKGRRIEGFRVEQKIDFVREVYLGFMVDAGERGIRILLSADGGVDVEDHATAMLTAVAAPDVTSLIAAASALVAALPGELQGPLSEAVAALADVFIAFDATLLEVNPLFVLADGSWIAGDMKLALDENAFPRQPALERVVRARPEAYRESLFKLDHDFDYVGIDPQGQVGMLTTGAGLSMMLIDEMLQAGRRPFNFCDVRTGLLRGSPVRLIEVLKQFAEGPAISVVLVNIFAGITDLDEFARLLLAALDAVPEVDVPIVARLIGNNFEAARRTIAESGRHIEVEMDLDKALKRVIEKAETAA